MAGGRYSLAALFLGTAVVCAFLAALRHPTYHVAIASRVLTFCLAILCLMSVLVRQKYNGGAAAALIGGAIWLSLIGNSVAFVVSEWISPELPSHDEATGFSSSYLATIVHMAALVVVSTVVGGLASLLAPNAK